MAEALAREGFSLALCGTRAESAAAGALEALRALGAEVLACPRGHRLAGRPTGAARRGAEPLCRAARAQNNAGVAPLVRADLLETSEESFERVTRINLQGPFF